MSAELELRQRVVTEARSWLGTPWHHYARVKGAGVDCGLFLAAIFEEAGVIPPLHVPWYPQDWALHRSEQIFLGIVEQFSVRDDWSPPLPGDILLFRYGRCLSHAALVVDGANIIHAHLEQRRVVLDNVIENGPLAQRLEGKWNPWRLR